MIVQLFCNKNTSFFIYNIMPIFNPYGRAIEYPLRCSNGSAAIVTGVDAVAQAIFQRLGIAYGSLPATPSFGSRLEKILFEPIDSIAVALGATFIREALRNEGRINVRSVQGEIDSTVTGRINFTIEYELRQTEEIQSLVYPFDRQL